MRTMLCCLLLIGTKGLSASSRNKPDNNLANYLAHVQMSEVPPSPTTLGSLWIDNGRMAALSTDYKAGSAGDLISTVVVHDLPPTNPGNVSTGRAFTASSGVD